VQNKPIVHNLKLLSENNKDVVLTLLTVINVVTGIRLSLENLALCFYRFDTFPNIQPTNDKALVGTNQIFSNC